MHRTPAWDPVPGTFADRRELGGAEPAPSPRRAWACSSWCRTAAPARTPAGIAKEFEWMTPLARDTNRPFSVALVQNLGYPDTWREVLRLAEAAAACGAHVVPQVAVRARRHADGLRHRDQSADAVPGGRRSARAAARRGRRAAPRSRPARSPAGERQGQQRRHPRRDGDARPRLPARSRRRALVRDLARAQRRRAGASSAACRRSS